MLWPSFHIQPPTRDGVRPKALCYIPDRETGIAVLKLFHTVAEKYSKTKVTRVKGLIKSLYGYAHRLGSYGWVLFNP